ncbi:MAG: flagellar basal-body rod protein FlgG [Rhodospirillaceae bacterium]
MRSLAIGATGMQAQQLNVEVISNNLANSSTNGFKRQRAEFQDLLYQNMRRVGSTSSDAGTIVPSGIQIGAGVRTASVYRVMEQGNLTVTDNKLDIAVNGNGFFQILLPSGETAYTRDGAFQLSPSGQIVTSNGYTLSPAISIPTNVQDITISPAGQVQVKIAGTTTPSTVGTIALAAFANDAGLEAVGDNLFLQTPASGSPTTGNPGATGYGSLVQGSLETSNVNVVQEITSLITAQRAYEMNSRVIKTTDEMMQTVGQLR